METMAMAGTTNTMEQGQQGKQNTRGLPDRLNRSEWQRGLSTECRSNKVETLDKREKKRTRKGKSYEPILPRGKCIKKSTGVKVETEERASEGKHSSPSTGEKIGQTDLSRDRAGTARRWTGLDWRESCRDRGNQGLGE